MEEEGYSEEEELLIRQDTFERKCNFRFEEPDADATHFFVTQWHIFYRGHG